MTIEQAFIALISACCGVLGWFARELYAAMQKLRQDLSALEVRLGTDYVRYDRLKDMLSPIKEGIDEIKAAMTHKADKP
jgi:cell division protein FtsB